MYNENFRSDEIDFESGFIKQEPFIYSLSGPRREVIPDYIKSDREINKHQEKITHNDTCRCKQYEFDDLVVMYEHIEQYPQFRCYCYYCLKKLEMDLSCHQSVSDENRDEGFRILLSIGLKEKGIDFI